MPFGFQGGVDPLENLVRSAEAEAVIRDVVGRLLGQDYFSRNNDVRRSGLMSASSYGNDYAMEDAVRIDDIRRVNVAVQIANNSVTPRMLYAEIHPKLSPNDGRFPRDFELPRRMDEILSMEITALDRILQVYGLPRDLSSSALSLSPFHSIRSSLARNPDTTRDAKLLILLQYLGVDLEGDNDSRRAGGALGGNSSARDADRLEQSLRGFTSGGSGGGLGLAGSGRSRGLGGLLGSGSGSG
ncbi:hypothetical protein BJ875DRAFT_481237 [Amylocarpus encephaloides]|uniref:Uncharacterized protein n=1 Tax=Amylocarpus encephaloides TaxID=45428 RepID=A0A9P7YPD4_9HELO|nr:hypothetical protein BJ875DRAFT_481237 [Amylocarpus encephaloides]